MTRKKHSVTRREYLSADERGRIKHGTQCELLGAESMLPFGFCALSCKAPVNPVITPHGMIFDKECILEHLAKAKRELHAQALAFERQTKRASAKETLEAGREDREMLAAFQARELGIRRSAERPEDNSEISGARSEYMSLDKREARAKNFWTKEDQPQAAPAALVKPDAHTKCPMTGKKLRLKDLIPIKLERLQEDGKEERGMYCCALSKKSLVYSQAYVVKPSGLVISEKCYKDVVKPSMTCPVSSRKLAESDIIKVIKSGSGFSAQSNIRATQYIHVAIKVNEGGSRTLKLRSRY